MNLPMIIIFSLLFLLSTTAVYLVFRLTEPLTDGMLARISRPLPGMQTTAKDWLGELGRKTQIMLGVWMPQSFREENWQQSSLRVRCIQAGYRDFSSALVYVGSKVLLAMALPFIAIFAISLTAAPLGNMAVAAILFATFGLGFFIPDVVLRFLIARRQRQLFEAFPDALDLIRICVEAGLGLDAAIQRIGQEFKRSAPALADEFTLVSLELRAGAGRPEALRNLARRTGLKEINAFVTMLIQADRFGTGIAESIRTHADQLRLSRRLKAEEIAATISTRLLFPLIFCIFPALLLVLMGPAGLSIQQHLIPAAKVR
jgi:tight adherence protein C